MRAEELFGVGVTRLAAVDQELGDEGRDAPRAGEHFALWRSRRDQPFPGHGASFLGTAFAAHGRNRSLSGLRCTFSLRVGGGDANRRAARPVIFTGNGLNAWRRPIVEFAEGAWWYA